MAMLPFLMTDGDLSRADGFLVFIYGLYVYWILKVREQNETFEIE
jgi:hypothetical protein